MVQVRVLTPLFGVSDVIEMDEAKAWIAHAQGLVAFKAHEDAFNTAIQAGQPYREPDPPLAEPPQPPAEQPA